MVYYFFHRKDDFMVLHIYFMDVKSLTPHEFNVKKGEHWKRLISSSAGDTLHLWFTIKDLLIGLGPPAHRQLLLR